jgi:predicted nucleotidyltransferase
MDLSHPMELVTHRVDGRILEVLSRADAAFTGRQVHALVGEHSVAGVQAGLARLRHQGIVSVEPAGRAILYRLNVDHLAAVHVRGLAHLRHELLRRLRAELESGEPRPLAAFLFGSAARQDGTADSDIDICAVRPREIADPDHPEWRNRVESLARTVTAWTGNDTRVVEFGEDEVRAGAGSDPLLVSIRDEGIPVAGDDSLLRPGRVNR